MEGHQEPDTMEGLNPVDEEPSRKGAERAQGRLICWTTSGQVGVHLLPENLDIGSFSVLDQGRIAASKGVQRRLIEVAEAAGYSQEMCAWYKVTIGYALLLTRGQLDTVPGVPAMPRPDFIWATNSCYAMLWAAEALGQILDVPVIGIDLPFEYEVANRQRNLRYVESQLREVLDMLETWTGRHFDWSRLREHIKGLAELAELRNGITQMCNTCPSVCSALDLVPAAWAHRFAPVEESKRVYGALREEIEGKIERCERDVSDEKIRIVWLGEFPHGKAEALREMLARHGASLCSSDFSRGGPPERGEGLDPRNPLGTVAWLLEGVGSNRGMDARIEDRYKPSIEGYNADGIIFHMSRTCKIYGVPMLVTAAQVEEELGVPTLIVESDSIDPAFYAETQVEKRIETFLDSIARRKAGV